MPISILMPALSPTMEEGKLAKWHVQIGTEVTAGDVIAEIETDKATMEVEAVEDGKLAKILVDAGTDQVKVNTPIALLLEEGEAEASLDNFDASSSSSPAMPETVAQIASSAPASNGGTGSKKPVQAQAPTAGSNGARIFASPLARRIAAQKGVDLTQVKGSGPNGRVVKNDIEKFAGGAPSAGMPPALQSGTSTATHVAPVPDKEIFALYEEGSYDLIPHDNMRKVIAERLVIAKATVPHFYLRVDCNLDSLLSARKRLNNASPEGEKAYKLSVNDFIIKALALALQKVPGANSSWSEQGVLRHKHSDVAVAVAVEGGLFTPVIRKAESKTLTDISADVKDFASRAKAKRLAPHEYMGGSTSVSNLGMFGIKSFDAVINPPHGTILAVGQGEQRPVVENGDMKVATMMSVTLSCDHRVVDGALGAQLLGAFKGFIEDPVTMII